MRAKTVRTQTLRSLLDQKGMSLMEIMIVITLMAVVGTIAATQVTARMQEGYQQTARTQMQNLLGQVREYYRYCSRYPTEEQGLEALEAKPTTGPECANYPASAFLEGKVPKDPWGTAYGYKPSADNKIPVITSYGANKVEGGEGFDADLHSNDQQ